MKKISAKKIKRKKKSARRKWAIKRVAKIIPAKRAGKKARKRKPVHKKSARPAKARIKRIKNKTRTSKIKPKFMKPIRKNGPSLYALNANFEFFYELRDLILKSSPAEKDKMVEKINKLGRVKLVVISGIFINKENADPLISDLLIVGDDIDRRKLRVFLKALEAEVGKEIRFAIMDKEEFQYRLAMFDRFIRVLIEGPHEKLINRLGI